MTIQLHTRSGDKKTPQEYADVLRGRKKFKAGGSLKGEPTPYGAEEFGRLDHMWYESAKMADYVVYSHSTPIAWHIPGEGCGGGWVVPGNGSLGFNAESQTTNGYRRIIRAALDHLGGYRETL